MRSPLTDKFLRIVALRDEVKTWPQDEQDFFLDMLVPETSPVKESVKKTRKKRGTKSARASSLQQQIAGATGKPHLGDGPVCVVCSHTEDYEDHQQPSPHYHEFQPPQKAAATGD